MEVTRGERRFYILTIFGPGLLVFASFLVVSGFLNSPPEFGALLVKDGAVSAVGQANAHRLLIFHDGDQRYRLRSDCTCNRQLPGHEVRVWVEPDVWGRDLYDVWELRKGDRTLLNYGDKAAMVRLQNRQAIQIGGGLMAIGVLVLPFWWRRWRRPREGEHDRSSRR